MAVRYTPAELAEVQAAAARDGLVAGAWLAAAGLALAGPAAARTDNQASREELDDLEVARRIGHLLNQLVKRLHSAGTPSPAANRILALTWRAVERLDDAGLAVARHRRPR